MILGSVVITSLFYVKDYPKIIPVLFLTVGFGLIGFLDDYLKVVMKRSDGLFPKQKDGIADCSDSNICLLCSKDCEDSAYNADSIFGWKISGYWMACCSAFIYCGNRNCKRNKLTDGLDGLASSVTVLVATFFYSCCSWNKERN